MIPRVTPCFAIQWFDRGMLTIFAKARNKLTFPLSVAAIQLAFIIIYFAVSTFDEYGEIRLRNSPPATESEYSIEEYFPCKLFTVIILLIKVV